MGVGLYFCLIIVQTLALDLLHAICAALGVMANMGVKGSLAGTALRKAYVQFADVKVQKILREVGVETTDSSGNLRKRMRPRRKRRIARTSEMRPPRSGRVG